MYKFLSGIKNAKAGGIDNLPERILEKSKDNIILSLIEIFNVFIRYNISPDDLETCQGVSHL